MELLNLNCIGLLEALQAGIFIADPDGHCLYINSRAQQILGRKCDGLLGHAWLDGVHPDDREWVKDTWERCNREIVPYHVENRFLRPDGTELWASVAASLQELPDGSTQYVGTIQDITKRRERQANLIEKEARLEFALSSAHIGLIDWSIPTGRLFINEEWTEIVGVPARCIADNNAFWQERIHPEDWLDVQAIMDVHRTGEVEDYQVEYRIRHDNGEWRHVHSRGRIWMRDDEGRPLRSISIHTDVTDTRRMEREREQQSYFIERIARFSPDLVCIYNFDTGRTVYINDAAGSSHPHFEEMAAASKRSEFGRLIHPEDQSALELHALRLSGLPEGASREIEYRVILSTGDERWLRSRDSVFDRNPDGSAKNILSIVQDMTLQRRNQELFEAYAVQAHEARAKLELLRVELEEANKKLADSNVELSRLSTTDPLTGLLNRRYFEEAFSQLIEQSTAEERCLSVVMFDVDHFKRLNDTYGHQEGDEVLKTLAQIVRENVPLTCPCVRYGGEEFLVVLEDHGPTRSTAMAEKIRQALESHPWSPRAITASFGISSRVGNVTADELIDQADQALYIAKDRGRNRTIHFKEVAEARAA